MRFEIVSDLRDVETFATGLGIRELPRLIKFYGRGRWRKRKGIAEIRLPMASCGLRNYTGTRRLELAGKSSRSNVIWIDRHG